MYEASTATPEFQLVFHGRARIYRRRPFENSNGARTANFVTAHYFSLIHPSHSKSNDTAIDCRVMVPMEPWSIVLLLDFEISWAWSVFLTVAFLTSTMEMDFKCRQGANVKECESEYACYSCTGQYSGYARLVCSGSVCAENYAKTGHWICQNIHLV
jgi:hypothetical protein